MTSPVYLADRSACGAYGEGSNGAAIFAVEVPQPRPWYCRKCQAGLVPAHEYAQPGEAVGLVDHNPDARWVVLDRNDDMITIRPLGLPNFPERCIPLAMVRPKFSYQRLEQARTARRTR